jgi:Leucine-rich repeat (LRR) protein
VCGYRGDTDADLNDDGEIDVSEALMVPDLKVSKASITSLDGINNFINLKGLECEYNLLTFLNVSKLKKLEYLNCRYNSIAILNLEGLSNIKLLFCSHNQINALDLSGFKILEVLNCNSNKLITLDLKDLLSLQDLSCSYNQITHLDLKGLVNLKYLGCNNNQLVKLDLRELIYLESVRCSYNQLIELKVEGLINLTELFCSVNLLTSLEVNSLVNIRYFLDCSHNKLSLLDTRALKKLNRLYCNNNQLKSLLIKSGNNGLEVAFKNNTNLEYICCDELQINSIVTLVKLFELPNCVVNSECNTTKTWDIYTKINIFPNPVTTILSLEIKENWNKAEIFDIAGRIIRSVSLDGNSLDVSELESGTYFVRLKDGEKVGIVKFVKL